MLALQTPDLAVAMRIANGGYRRFEAPHMMSRPIRADFDRYQD
jgi:hypothetical protein